MWKPGDWVPVAETPVLAPGAGRRPKCQDQKKWSPLTQPDPVSIPRHSFYFLCLDLISIDDDADDADNFLSLFELTNTNEYRLNERIFL